MVASRASGASRIVPGCIVALKITLSRARCRFTAGHEFRVLRVEGMRVQCLPAGAAIMVWLPIEQLELVRAAKRDVRKRDSIQTMLRSGRLILGTQLRSN